MMWLHSHQTCTHVTMQSAKKQETGPGPGSYELQYYESIRTTLEKNAGKTSAPFQAPEYVDRFGNPLASTSAPYNSFGAPAPSVHDVAGVRRISSPEKGVSAPFKSTAPSRTDIDLKDASKAPGPAFYSPQVPVKRTSHHLNARKRLV